MSTRDATRLACRSCGSSPSAWASKNPAQMCQKDWTAPGGNAAASRCASVDSLRAATGSPVLTTLSTVWSSWLRAAGP